MKYINVGIDEELHKKIKIESAQRGISMTKYVDNALRAKYSPEKKFKNPVQLYAHPNKKTKTPVNDISAVPVSYRGGSELTMKDFNPQPKNGKKK